MINPLISVIVPTYNSQKYINECLNSILKQTYSNLEIIIIDDGSSDNTIDIINDYKDSRIKLFTKENSGVSSARNMGLAKANGEYILFVDSDDYLINDSVVKNLVNNINNVDVIRFGYSSYNNDKKNDELLTDYLDKYKNGLSFIEHTLTINKKYGWYLWQYLFKRELWDNISFPEGKIFEDTYTIYQVLLKANNIKVLKDNYYVYRYNGISLSKKVNLKICLDLLDVMNDSSKKINNIVQNDKVKELLLNNISYGYITDVDVLYLLNKEDRKVLKDQLTKNSYLLNYCKYGIEVIIKILIKIFGIDIVSKILNVRRVLWKRK